MEAEAIITALAAFLSGAGSVLTGFLALRYERRRGDEACAQRIAALREGMQLADMVDERRQRRDVR